MYQYYGYIIECCGSFNTLWNAGKYFGGHHYPSETDPEALKGSFVVVGDEGKGRYSLLNSGESLFALLRITKNDTDSDIPKRICSKKQGTITFYK
jgi:hypothetical protein